MSDEVRDPFLRLWLGLVLPNRDAFELGRGTGVLAASREQLAASQQQAFASVVRDWLGDRQQAACGPWWGAGEGVVEALALRGHTPAAAATARWATGVDAAAEVEGLRRVLAGGPHANPEELLVAARDGQGVVTAAELYART